MQGHIATFSSPVKWIKQGIEAIRRAPFGMVSICVFYVFMFSVLSTLPFVGLVLASFFMPFGTMLVIEGTREAYNGRQPSYAVMVDLFKDVSKRSRLFKVGLIYAFFLIIANYIYLLTAMDAISQWQVKDGQIVWESVAQHFPWTAAILTILCYLAGQMATWFAPALVAWKNMTVGKAVFYSFFGCLRNWLPIVVLTCIVIGLTLLATLLVIVFCSAVGLTAYMVYFMTPVIFIILTVGYGTIWPMWDDIYGDIAAD